MSWTLGIDLGGTKLLLVAHSGADRATHTRSTGTGFRPQQLVAEVAAFVERIGRAPDAVGLAIPGLVEGPSVVLCEGLPEFNGWDAATMATGGSSLYVINDVDAALIEEASEAGDRATMGVILVGTGIGAAFMLDGRPARGANGWAGELGYLPVSIGPGDVVRTLDSVASGAAIALACGVDASVLAKHAAHGDRDVLREIRTAGHAFGLGIAAVVNLFNPSVLVVDGGVMRLPGYREAALAFAKEHTIPPLWRACSIRPARAGELVVALGAIRAAVEHARGAASQEMKD
jgi:predicted NBD/HSP70 family sugar kinase